MASGPNTEVRGKNNSGNLGMRTYMHKSWLTQAKTAKTYLARGRNKKK